MNLLTVAGDGDVIYPKDMQLETRSEDKNYARFEVASNMGVQSLCGDSDRK